MPVYKNVTKIQTAETTIFCNFILHFKLNICYLLVWCIASSSVDFIKIFDKKVIFATSLYFMRVLAARNWFELL